MRASMRATMHAPIDAHRQPSTCLTILFVLAALAAALASSLVLPRESFAATVRETPHVTPHETPHVTPRSARAALTKWCTAPSGQKFISCSPTTSAPAGVLNHFNFRVRNPTSNDAGYKTAVSCSGMDTSVCKADLNVIFVMSDGGETDVGVSWQTPADVAGTLFVTVVVSPVGSGATDTLTATLHATMFIPPTYTVSVTPDGSDAYRTQPLSTSYAFTVENLGNSNATYKLTATCSGGATGCSAPSTKSVSAHSSSSVTVSFNSGTAGSEGTVKLEATADSTGGSGTVGGIVTSDEGFINVKPFTHTVAVTPGGGAITKGAGSSDTATFTVTLTGNATSVTYDLDVTCGEPVYGCSAKDTVTATQTTPGTVKVAYSTRSDTHGGVGSIALRAYSVYGSKTYESTGSYQVTVPNTADDIVIGVASPTTAIERDACLTVAAGEAAAYECGDLRIVHGVPGVRTMGKVRSPTLLYSSETAVPKPTVRADLLLKSSATTPDSITGTLVVGSHSCGNQHWSTSGWTPGTVRRVTAVCPTDTLSTGAYPFTLQITSVKSGATKNFSTSGTLIVVNRSSSPYGAGWSMAGLERLYFPADTNTRLWVAGDGSARVYRRVGTTGGITTFFADSLDGPDSLTYDSDSSTYTRWAAHRLRVVFNGTGLQTATTNRLGQTTSFSYTGSLLQSITVAPSDAGLTFTFGYTSGKLTSISSPGISAARVTRIYQSSGRVDSVTDADTSKVKFAYSGSGKLVTKRTDRLGHATSYAYNTTSGKLSSVSVAMASPTPAIVTYFFPAEGAALSGSATKDTSSVSTIILDPRSHITAVWVDRFGAPRRVTDPVGRETKIERGDTRWPLLATKLTAPGDSATGRLTSTAVYDGHGNTIEQTVIEPLGSSSGDAVTTYAYDEKYDFPVRIQGPTGEVWRAALDTATGNRVMESPTDTSGLHATSYRYDSTCGMVRAVLAPGTPADSVVYDGRCNPSGVQSPMGYWSTIKSDTIGRVARTTAPDGMKDSTIYDVMGRVVRQITKSSDGTQQLIVISKYDRSGRDTSVSRIGSPNPLSLDTLTNSYRYDWAGRRVASIAPDGAVDSTVYDATSNATKLVTRLGGTSKPITMVYDAANRLIKRSVPAYDYSAEHVGLATQTGSQPWAKDYPLYPNDGGTGYTVVAQVDTFAFDAAGRMTLANNGDAKVSRTYYPNGLTKTETQKIRTLAEVGSGGNFTAHVYTTSYEYDLAGRNTKITVPTQLAPRVQSDTLAAVLMLSGHDRDIHDEIDYTYDTGANGTGWLERVDGLLPGDAFRYHYTPRGEVALLSSLEPVPEVDTVRIIEDQRTYNDDGALSLNRTIREVSVSGPPTPTDTLRNESFTLDAVGRVLSSSDVAKYGLEITPTDITYEYSPMGQLTSSEYETTSPSGMTPLAADETASYDAMGNWRTRSNSAAGFTPVGGGGKGGEGGFPGSLVSRTGRYEAVSGRLRAETMAGDASTTADTLIYDVAGNLHAMITTNAGSPVQYNERVSYYGVDGKLAAADARAAGNPGTGIVGHTAFEEYRYDALGRRVISRARRTCDDQQGAGNHGDEVSCEVSAIRRTVWSGTSELAEIQMPAGDSTPADTVENDTLAVKRARQSGIPYPYYDANRLYGRVLYVHGLAVDQPLAITRVNYADASDFHTGTVTWQVYAPFSIIPLWNSAGRGNRYVMGGTADPGGDYLCVDEDQYRCAEVGLDKGEFPYSRSGSDASVWQGTVLVDKADATGTYYRRNRSYDPNTARFTQEDPIGLAGGMNLYGFASGNPVNYSDPFGLCDEPPGLKEGEIGICIEAFIAGPSAGVPAWAADNRTFSPDGGTYKTSQRLIINLGARTVRNAGSGIGSTHGIRGLGWVSAVTIPQSGGVLIAVRSEARTKSPWPLGNIDYIFNIRVGNDGAVSLAYGSHDGFPSYEIWVYRKGKDPQLLYHHNEGNVFQLTDPLDVGVRK